MWRCGVHRGGSALHRELQALEGDKSGKECGALVKKAKRTTEDGKGPCETKGVTKGDELVAVNGQEADRRNGICRDRPWLVL
jgi:hypothetical protein